MDFLSAYETEARRLAQSKEVVWWLTEPGAFDNIRSIGAKALQKHGAAELTLSQLAQVETEGLWGGEDIGYCSESCTIHYMSSYSQPSEVISETKKVIQHQLTFFESEIMAPILGLEPRTHGLTVRCSTN